MAQLFFRYGAMSSGKTIEILKVAHNYEAQGRKIALMTSGLDNRSGVGTVASRIGLHRRAIPITEQMNLFDYIKKMNDEDLADGDGKLACVLIDEAQFLKRHHVLECAKIVDEFNIPVMTFGLKNDFQNHLFEGSENLLIFADKIEEMKTICHYCGHKATMNLRINNGKPVYEGEQVQIGGDESYYPVCRYHYFHPGLKK
ncbi:thymidine kinase [Lactobacillus kefiranofaciens]|uniref:Thymidine kinase n=1 Tax=Lactobacillus kefiranofaciens TaxID=267818 RepID=A0AAX3UEG8_9LACO|nr:thymidine kinase [Lactobacillus kefiranofaciens]AEG40605.1 Thymidine kinase [Lactobacillus kefiranofaciens subsp. kefiranofaciens]KRL28994.1 thymidine kinase [Lactobacillus kefiranofaciens subsp. kefirgranum DSM 10550 = JCM 8572]KRM22608.1 thymidine kinase [Lactobacillus kefiranofaciens subsp. kefiranofaciens DSM 5016 = JCM 6985]MCJ2171746.1 thymidine kinase [Lactobacillus kefiranofaciens]MCP9330696.1 thymidine kinase [Lactobacillus kefiranofaciens]